MIPADMSDSWLDKSPLWTHARTHTHTRSIISSSSVHNQKINSGSFDFNNHVDYTSELKAAAEMKFFGWNRFIF